MATPKQRQKVVADWLKAEELYEEFVQNVLNSGCTDPEEGMGGFFKHYLGHIRQGMWPDYYNILCWGCPNDDKKFEEWKKVIEKWRKYVDEKGFMRDSKYY